MSTPTAQSALTVDTLIRKVDRLPPAPQILPRLQQLLQDPDSCLDDVTDQIRMDAALTAQIVRMANSAFYGNPSPVTQIGEAVSRLGFREVYKLVGLLVARGMLDKAATAYRMDAGALWERSVVCAEAMQQLAGHCAQDADNAYTVGLMHAVGRLVISRYHELHGIPGWNEVMHALDIESEYRVLGFSDAEVGGTLLSRWGFCKEVYTPIAHQHYPTQAGEDFESMAIMFHLTREAVADLDAMGDKPLLSLDTDLLLAAGLTANDMNSIVRAAYQFYNRFNAAAAAA